jgi:hypothetical protein
MFEEKGGVACECRITSSCKEVSNLVDDTKGSRDRIQQPKTEFQKHDREIHEQVDHQVLIKPPSFTLRAHRISITITRSEDSLRAVPQTPRRNKVCR